MANTPQVEAEIARARREMLNHLSQRVYHLPRQVMKAFKQTYSAATEGYARKVWRDLIKADSAPRRALHMPGRK